MPTVVVRYFAQLRESKGLDDETIVFEAGTTVAQLYTELFPEPRVPVGYARNAAYVDGETRIEDGDEVVFIPPIGGG